MGTHSTRARASQRLVSRGFLAAATSLCLSLTACLLGCGTEVRGIDAYPGSSIGPGHRMEKDGYLYLQQLYSTPAGYGDVVKFYEGYVAQEPGWEGGRSYEISSWTRNMTVPDMGEATPIDPSQMGGAIIVIQEPNRTVIRTYAAYPNAS